MVYDGIKNSRDAQSEGINDERRFVDVIVDVVCHPSPGVGC